MNESLLYQTPSWLIVTLLFFAIAIFHWIGYSIRKREIKNKKKPSNEGLNAIVASLLGLLALLLSFSFNMSSIRYDSRRTVIYLEANNIRNVISRADMYPDSIRNKIKLELKKYLEARIAYYTADISETKINLEKQKAEKIYSNIWNLVIELSKNPENLARTQQMVPALNEMINSVTSRDAIKNATIPNPILWLLFIVIVFASFTVGYNNIGNQKNHILAAVFSLTVILTVFIILNLDRPRRGIITVNSTEQKIVELRSLFAN